MRYIKGSDLEDEDQLTVLQRYINRYTLEHCPDWAKGKNYEPHFASDRDWLENTVFGCTKKGRLDKRSNYYHSTPTWPYKRGE